VIRRLSIKVIATILFATLALASSAQAQPNVVLIVTDDQRINTLGPELTPAIWTLIRQQGVEYRNAHIPTSVCCPSRASILTGLYAHSHGVYTNNVANNGGWPTFFEHGMEDRTLAVALRDVGYRTALIGKYLNGGAPYPGHVPTGWDVFQEFHGGYYNYVFSGHLFGSDPSDYSTDVIRDQATRFIAETPGEQPLFLYFAPYAPHSASIAAVRHIGMWQDRINVHRVPRSFTERMGDKPPWLQNLGQTTPATYESVLTKRAESMMAVDEAVAAIVGQLEATGRMQDTLIFFLSDNGILLGEHRVYGHKNLPYRMATQVPMLARWDGHIAADSEYRKPVLNIDLAPTIAAATGATMTTDGIDLMGTLRRNGFPLEGAGWQHRPRLFVPAFCGYRTNRFMYARYASGHEELYAYRRDPQELHNVAKHRLRLKAVLKAKARRTCSPVPPGFSWR
jgi:N-acetylglucosamine-6-sulfatase